MRLALALIFTLLSGCAESRLDKAIDSESGNDTAAEPTGSYWTEERKALYHQDREGARQAREQYIAATRPVLGRQFRQEYPSMAEADIELLVNDALEKGLRPEAGRRPDGPIRQPQMDCMSSPWRNSTFANCY